jgi:phage terminase small subunit
MSLKPKVMQFCEEYLACGHSGKAALSVGYAKSSASSVASKLLKRQDVLDYIDILRQKTIDRCQLSADNILDELKKIAYANTVSDFDVGGEIDGKIVNMKDKFKSLELLGKYMRLFDGAPIEVNVSRPLTDEQMAQMADVLDGVDGGDA